MSDVAPSSNGGTPTEGGQAGGQRSARGSPWPAAIIIGLILVAIVNLVFIVMAVRGGEPVVESYSTGQR